MTGGIIQLVAIGPENIFLTMDPQITFFKIIYRRHTNFAMEAIPQKFTTKLDFGRKASCTISKSGDLVSNIWLVLTTPYIPKFTIGGEEDTITKFAWIRKLGYGLIKSVEIEIGGQLIDKHYGDWLNIYSELLGLQYKKIDKLIGNIESMYSFTNGKGQQLLYIPLQFWFNRIDGLALPLVSLIYSEVKINVEINNISNCYLINPTHYIELDDTIVNFEKGEYIEQSIGDSVAKGMFNYFDITTKRLYYLKISRENFLSIQLTNPTYDDIYGALHTPANYVYRIYGLTSGYYVMPGINKMQQVHSHSKLPTLSLQNCFLLVNYIYLDIDERKKLASSEHEYLIEKIYITKKTIIQNSNATAYIDLIQPVKYFVWVAQYGYLLDTNNNDLFNYTDDYKYDENNNLVGNNIILQETLLFNNQERLSYRDSLYFSHIQPVTYFNLDNVGINVYSFSLNPTLYQPSGYCNSSQISDIDLRLTLNKNIKFNNEVILRGYGVVYEILRIVNGISGIVFSK